MFTKKWPRRALSDTGFELQIKNRGSLLYKEGGKAIKVNSEYLAHNSGIAIWSDSIKQWDAPYDEEIIKETKKQNILDIIHKILEFKNINAEIYGRSKGAASTLLADSKAVKRIF